MVDVADSNAAYYYHFDGLGSVAALSDVNNVVVESYSYDVFGAPTIYDANYAEISKSAVGNPYMFTARRADDETALYYYRARYYAFDIGRFLQPDPIGYTDGLNLYGYVMNNPLSYTDPLGLIEWLISGDETLFNQATEYLSGSSAFQETYEYLESQSGYISIIILEPDHPATGIATPGKSGKSKIVAWNPFLAAMLPNGSSQSPSMVLAHELEHIKNMFEGDVDWSPGPEDFATVDDMNVILGPETQIASQLGEGVNTHGIIIGEYGVAGPISTWPTDFKKYAELIDEFNAYWDYLESQKPKKPKNER